MNGNAHYRLEVPIRTAEDLGLAVAFFEGQTSEQWSWEDRLMALACSDIHVYLMTCSKGMNQNLKEIRKLKPEPDEHGNIIYPPSYVFDMDDSFDNVSIFNTAYRRMGIHGPNGEEMGPGDKIMVSIDGESEPRVLWEDGKYYGEELFSFEKNKERIGHMVELATMSEGVSVPVEYLAQKMRDKYQCKNVYVFPNSVRFDEYPQAELAPHDEVRIMWQGGISHWQDWYPLKDALARVAEKYTNVRWILWGTVYPWVHKVLPESRSEFMEWTKFDRYFSRLCTVGHDINLCPLVDNEFNRCKSAIKWYEASALLHTPATLAANVGPYTEIQDGETGLLYNTPEEFELKLGELIENATLRKKLAAGAKDWVREYRDAKKTVPKLVDWWRSLRPGG